MIDRTGKHRTAELNEREMALIAGGVYSPGLYREEAKAFLRECLGEANYERIMSHRNGHAYPYVVARIFLKASDWKKYVWIEHHGSVEGYPMKY